MKPMFTTLAVAAFALSLTTSLAVADNNSQNSVRKCADTGKNPGQAFQSLEDGPAAGRDRTRTPPEAVAVDDEFDTVGEAIRESCVKELPS